MTYQFYRIQVTCWVATSYGYFESPGGIEAGRMGSCTQLHEVMGSDLSPLDGSARIAHSPLQP